MGLKIICILILGIFACNKVNQWKEPTKVCFNIDIESKTAAEGKLVFDSGYLTIESFVFDGKRTEGADVYFSKNYAANLNENLGESASNALSFDIPQGIYTDIDVALVSKNEQLPNLVLNGIFKNAAGNELPFRFEFSEEEVFHITGADVSGNETEVRLIENVKTKATILLDPAKWFDTVSAQSLEHAEKAMVDGKSTILINNNTNLQLYNGVRSAVSKNDQKAIFVKQS